MKNKIVVIAVAAILVIAGGFVAFKVIPKNDNTNPKAEDTNNASSENVKKPTKKSTAIEHVNFLKENALAIGKVVEYTAETDPNTLLGRPNQYTSKVNFGDTTLEQDEEALVGGSVEVFANKEDAQTRKAYLDNVAKEAPLFAEYSYLNGNALLRLSKSLTPDQAAKYEEIFMK